jgi:HEPN domain-containing protein
LTNITLAQSYLIKATKRLKILAVLLDEEAYSDVVREAQEIVELSLKGMLRAVGIEPPKWHDVGPMLEAHADRFLPDVGRDVPRLVAISAWLRKEREFAFYGDEDFIPTSQYAKEDAQRAIADAEFTVALARRVIAPP